MRSAPKRVVGDNPQAERLFGALRDRALLLVLNIFKRVVDVAPVVAGLLAVCPTLKILATSQAALQLSGENFVEGRRVAAEGEDMVPLGQGVRPVLGATVTSFVIQPNTVGVVRNGRSSLAHAVAVAGGHVLERHAQTPPFRRISPGDAMSGRTAG